MCNRIVGLTAAFVFGGASVCLSQEQPARARLEPPSSEEPAAPPRPAAIQSRQSPATTRPVLGAARLVTTAVELQPVEPAAGQKVRLIATVRNRGRAPSRRGTPFVLRCTVVASGPACPSTIFRAALPGIEPGKSARTVIELGTNWKAGRYRLLAGTALPRDDAKAVELIVASPAGRRGLNPQPEPPSLQAGEAGVPQTVTTTRNPARIAPADLAFGKPVIDVGPVKGGTETTFYRSAASVVLVWSSGYAAGFEWRWQVAGKPFPSEASLSPPGLLGMDQAPSPYFTLDLAPFLPVPPGRGVEPPRDFYIRLIATRDGKPAGPPSNTVAAHYQPGAPPQVTIDPMAQQKAVEQFLHMARVFQVSILSAKEPIFADPSRWGCIVVIENPYAGKPFHLLAGYQAGHEYCPPKDPDKMEKSTGEKIWEGVAGFGKAWDGLGWAYDQAKSWVAGKFAEALPCEWLGEKAKSDCESVAKEVAGTAISVGLAAAGVPPSLPSTDQLGAMAEGEIAEGAAGYTCDLAESNGHTCTPEERAALAKLYQEAIGQLRKNLERQAQEPGCGDAQTAKELGLVPLPCFSAYPDTRVKPAPGSVNEPARVTARVTHVRRDPAFLPGCQVIAWSWMKSYSNQLGRAYDWQPLELVLPFPLTAVKPGQSAVVELALRPAKIGFMNSTPAETWWDLYSGGKGWVHVGTKTLESVASPDGRAAPIPCSQSDDTRFQVPDNPPWHWMSF